MTLNPNLLGNSPWQPGVTADAFIPDQLIGGDMKIVTDTATITGGAYLRRGTVLGQVTIGALAAAIAAAANVGSGTISAIAGGAATKTGTYTVKMKSATTFDVISPRGDQLAEGFALGAYADPQVNFTITAGGTAFVAGDTFTIAAVAGSGAYKIATAAAIDGSQTPATILVDDVDATAADVAGGIYLMGEFNGNAVTLGAGITLAAAKAALQMQNIYLKAPVSAADPS